MNAKQIDHSQLSTADCNAKSIQQFLEGSLASNELAALEEHLSSCLDCQQRIENSVAGSGLWQEAVTSLRDLIGDPEWEHDAPGADSNISQVILNSLAPTDDPQMLGRLGAYEIAGVVGQGGMGVVLKGFDRSLNRFVALKVLRPHLAISGSARQRFFREAKSAATVSHRNVMPIHSVAEDCDLPYLVMPYVRGISLQQRVAKQGPLEPLEIVRIGMQIAAGLDAAHAQGLVHRDIKPANIILESGVDKLWVTDFGLARMVDDASLTRTGVIAGTPEYMSPEQARGDSLDERSDLFSLGSLLYTLCTGHSPFRAESSLAVMRRITDDAPRSIREISPQIPEWLSRLVLKLLEKNPHHRFQSASEIETLLQGALASLQHPLVYDLPEKLLEMDCKPRPTVRRMIEVGFFVAAILAAGIWFASNLQWSSRIEMNSPEVVVQSANEEAVPAALATGGLAAVNVSQLRSDQILVEGVHVWVSIPDLKRFKTQFEQTQIGGLLGLAEMRPFFDQFKHDFDDLMSENQLLFELTWFDHEWVTGELCFAMVAIGTDERGWPRSSSPIVLANVVGHEDEAFGAMTKQLRETKQLVNQQVQGEEGAIYVKTKVHSGDGSATFFHCVRNGWLVVGTDAAAFFEQVERLGGELKNSLAERSPFQRSMARTELIDVEPDLNWFVEPLGLSQTILNFRQANQERPDQWGLLLERQGFGVFSGVGGRVALATKQHDLLHRCFVCTSLDRQLGEAELLKRRGVLDLVDFLNPLRAPFEPMPWVPDTASSVLIADWNMEKLLAAMGPIYDAFLEEPGAYLRILEDFKADPDLQLDVPKLAKAFGSRMAVVSHQFDPLNGQAESIGVFDVSDDPKFVIDSMLRATGGVKIVIQGCSGVVVDDEVDVADLDDYIFVLPGEVPNETVKPLPGKSGKRYYVLAHGELLVSENKELIALHLERPREARLADTAGYLAVHDALRVLTEEQKIGVYQFGYLDRGLKASYELFRRRELEWPDWFVRDEFEGESAGDGSEQESGSFGSSLFDGSLLPKNYAKLIAPRLGLYGGCLENEEDGFLVTGLLLKK